MRIDDNGKECVVCKEYKLWESFNKNKSGKGGYDNRCKGCAKAYRQTEEYKEANRGRSRDRYKDPIEREKQKARVAEQRKKPISEEAKEERAIKQRDRLNKWRKNNPERHRANLKKGQQKWMSNPKNKLSCVMSAHIRHRLDRGVKGNRDWESLVGYTIEELKSHLEGLWEVGMSWENHTLDGWHIDHVTPVKAFQFEKPEDQGFKECWALKNLMPRWATTDIAQRYGSSRIGNMNKSCSLLDIIEG